jgi:hypothetical protein
MFYRLSQHTDPQWTPSIRTLGWPVVAVHGARPKPTPQSPAIKSAGRSKFVFFCLHGLAAFQHGQVADREPVVLDLLVHHYGDAVDHGALLVRVTGSGRALA